MPIQNDVKKSNEEYVEEKLREMMLNFYSNNTNYEDEKNGCENIIRQIVEDCKVKVDIKIFDEIDRVYYYTDRRRIFKEKLIEAGVEVTDK